MSIESESRSIGREPTCDLVLNQPGVSGLHASLVLADDGLIKLTDSDSGSGTFLHRTDRWIRIRRITLCIGDRVRFGDLEVPLERLTAVFGEHANARLAARHFANWRDGKTVKTYTERRGSGPKLHKPMRNPVTGKIEEQGS